MYHKLIFEPRDLLFFRDGRPVNNGQGANWPLPQTAYAALSMAFRRNWPEQQPWEPVCPSDSESGNRKRRFPSLKTFGPLPVKNNEIYVPTPADLRPGKPGAIMAPLLNVPGKSNLPQAVRCPVGADLEATKETCNPWISLAELGKYLNGSPDVQTVSNSELFEIEERPGIEVDPDRHSAVDGKLFFGSYLRLHEDVRMCLFAECMSMQTDVIEKFYSGHKEQIFTFGGQRGVVISRLEKFNPENIPLPFNCGLPVRSKYIKWVLLSPAAYSRGWLPSFLDEDGRVMLSCPSGKQPVRSDFPTRKAYREACRTASVPVKARLVSAVVPKNRSCSGWNLERECPEETLNFVPPGTVYYFEAETEEDGMALAALLTQGRNSEFLGSQGLGMGVCTSFNYLDFNELKK